jgi:long-chain acyl-CoA synthetase
MSRIIEALAAHARNQPRKKALIDHSGSLTYSELYERVQRVADWMKSRQCQVVGYLLDNGSNWVTVDLAAQSAGVTAIPLPVFFSDSQLSHIIEDSGADLLIADRELPQVITGDGWQPCPFEYPNSLIVLERDVSNLYLAAAKVTYTSGTTGSPKGVCIDQDAIDRTSSSIRDAIHTEDMQRHLCIAPLSTLLENIAGLYAPILQGIEISAPALQEVGLGGSSSFDVVQFLQSLEAYRPSSLILVPQLLLVLVTAIEQGYIKPSYLKFVAVGGAHVCEQLLERAAVLDLPVYEGYGLSECTSVVTLNTPTQHRAGSVGKPLPHVDVRVNKGGEIEIRGAVMTGYLGEEKIADSWLNTGDLGYFDQDGFLYVNGRKKNVFITSFGRNVSPEWVESELSQQLAIANAVVTGEGRSWNLALIYPRSDENSQEDIRKAVREANLHLPDYARIGGWIRIDEPLTVESELLTSNGRIRRDAVLQEHRKEVEFAYAQSPSAAGSLVSYA